MEKSVRIGLCVYRDVSPWTNAGIFQLARAIPRCAMDFRAGADVVPARNGIAAALKEDYLLLLDGDMSFTFKAFKMLYDALEAKPEMGALSGLYIKWDGSEEPVCGWRRFSKEWYPPEKVKERVRELMKKGEPFPVDSFGGGFLLISKAALEKLEPPYFGTGWDRGGYFGNDTGFCKKLQEAGFAPSVHFGVHLGHVGSIMWAPNGEVT